MKTLSFLSFALFANQALAHASHTHGQVHGMEHLMLLLALVPVAWVLRSRWVSARKSKH